MWKKTKKWKWKRRGRRKQKTKKETNLVGQPTNSLLWALLPNIVSAKGPFLYADQVSMDRAPHTPARVWADPVAPIWSCYFYVHFTFSFSWFFFFFFSLVFFFFTIFLKCFRFEFLFKFWNPFNFQNLFKFWFSFKFSIFCSNFKIRSFFKIHLNFDFCLNF
jgi:hypothetical protein